MNIQMDESENLLCAVDDETFRIIDKLYTRAVSGKLLYKPPEVTEDGRSIRDSA